MPVSDVRRLKDEIRDKNIVVGVLAVPAGAAQQAADDLVEAGVRIIFNYSEALLDVPTDVTVHTLEPGGRAAARALLPPDLAVATRSSGRRPTSRPALAERAASCNQATNREPVVAYDEATIRAALDRLARKGWTRLASGPGSRAAKYRHLLDEALRLDVGAVSLLAVLMLRGPQTVAELRTRTERLHPFLSLEEVERALHALQERELVELQERRPGQKEQRYRQLLGSGDEQPYEAVPPAADPLEERLARLEERVAALEAERR